jgi:enoyl-CoA hydratase
MSEFVEIGVEGRMGVIALNRPAAINALTLDMVEAVSAALERWRGDEQVRVILFEGRGPRGFCSGGDVRAVRSLVLEGRRAEADAFFAAEYRMNGLISNYDKPVIALAHGVVMGGGIGIAGHADFRLAASDARYAMPEGAIGFFPDVGVNWLLARAPLHRALLFELLGSPVGAADAIALGLADCAIDPPNVAEARADLLVAATAPDPEAAIVGIMQRYSIVAGPTSFCDLADGIAPLLDAADAATIVDAIDSAAAADPDLLPIARTLRTRSPTTLEIALQAQRHARRLAGIDEVLAADLRLARWVSGEPDFAEGVRAVLVDKGSVPQWQPASLDAARRSRIAALLSARDPVEPAST